MKKKLVDAKAILQRLEKGIPLFEELPKIRSTDIPTVSGVECELEGPVSRHDRGEYPDHNQKHGYPESCERLTRDASNRWLSNGGRLYFDVNWSLEFCTPETRNGVEAVTYRAAMRRIIARDFQDNGDWLWYDTTIPYNLRDLENPQSVPSLGNHESYLAESRTINCEDHLLDLAPFLVARILIAGCGYINYKGQFELSPRTRVIQRVSSEDTMSERPLINLRELKSNGKNVRLAPNYERVHLICGESNPNQVTFFLRSMFTSLVIKLIEQGKLPHIEYDGNAMVEDLRRISLSSSKWLDESVPTSAESWDLKMRSIRVGPSTALDLLDLYAKAIEDNFGGRDVVVDTFLVIIKDTLEKLRFPLKNFQALGKRLDAWTKLNLFDSCWNADTEESFNGWKDDCRLLELRYHQLGTGGLINHLERKGFSGRIVTNKMIEKAMWHPPTSTRASFRGMLVSNLSNRFRIASREHDSWDSFSVMKDSDPMVYEFKIPDPLDPYDDLKERVRKWMGEK